MIRSVSQRSISLEQIDDDFFSSSRNLIHFDDATCSSRTNSTNETSSTFDVHFVSYTKFMVKIKVSSTRKKSSASCRRVCNNLKNHHTTNMYYYYFYAYIDREDLKNLHKISWVLIVFILFFFCCFWPPKAFELRIPTPYMMQNERLIV